MTHFAAAVIISMLTSAQLVGDVFNRVALGHSVGLCLVRGVYACDSDGDIFTTLWRCGASLKLKSWHTISTAAQHAACCSLYHQAVWQTYSNNWKHL